MTRSACNYVLIPSGFGTGRREPKWDNSAPPIRRCQFGAANSALGQFSAGSTRRRRFGAGTFRHIVSNWDIEIIRPSYHPQSGLVNSQDGLCRCQDESVGYWSFVVRVRCSSSTRQCLHLCHSHILQATPVLTARLSVSGHPLSMPRPCWSHVRLGRWHAPRRTHPTHIPRVRRLREESQLPWVPRRVRPTVVDQTAPATHHGCD